MLGTVFLDKQVNIRILGGLAVVLVGVALTRITRRARHAEPEQVHEPQPSP